MYSKLLKLNQTILVSWMYSPNSVWFSSYICDHNILIFPFSHQLINNILLHCKFAKVFPQAPFAITSWTKCAVFRNGFLDLFRVWAKIFMVFHMASLRTQFKRFPANTGFIANDIHTSDRQPAAQHLALSRHWKHHRIMWRCIIPKPSPSPPCRCGIKSYTPWTRRNTFR